MDVMDAIRVRRSYRSFTSEPVLQALLERLVEAAAWAPSSWNSQPVSLHVTTGASRDRVVRAVSHSTRHMEEALSVMPPEQRAAALDFCADLGGAPVVIAVSVPDASERLERINNKLAAGCAIENLLLAATAEGLGTCTLTFSFYVRDQIAEELGLEADRIILALLLVGHVCEAPKAPSHRLDIATYHD